MASAAHTIAAHTSAAGSAPLVLRWSRAAVAALCALALGLAIFAAAMAGAAGLAGGASGAGRPLLAAPGGFALARASLRASAPILNGWQGGDGAPLAPREAARIGALARAALIQEPSADEALSALALIAHRADPEAARALHRQAQALSRRNEISALALAIGRLEQGETGEALAMLGQSLRLRPALRDEVMPLLVGLLVDEAAIAPLARMLREQPGWSDEFWREAHQFGPGLANLVALRRRMAAQGGTVLPRHDEFLLQALVNQARFAEAEALAALVVPGFAAGLSGALRNADFAALPQGRPFDWRVFPSPTAHVFHDPASGTLTIAAMPGPRALVASQLVRMDDRRHRLLLIAGQVAEADRDLIGIEIVCASAPGKGRVRISGAAAIAGITFHSAVGCAHHFINLHLDARTAYPQGEIVIDAIRLEPGR